MFVKFNLPSFLKIFITLRSIFVDPRYRLSYLKVKPSSFYILLTQNMGKNRTIIDANPYIMCNLLFAMNGNIDKK